MQKKIIIEQSRDSSLELLRIICMLAIISTHIVIQTDVKETSGIGVTFFYDFVGFFGAVACSIYFIISAWFTVDIDKFRFDKVLKVWITFIMYQVPIVIIGVKAGFTLKGEILFALLPVNGCYLWFVGSYIILLLFYPILNLIICSLDVKKYKILLIIGFLLLVIEPSITLNPGLLNSNLWVMLFLYLLTGYIKKYGKLWDKQKALVILFTVSVMIVSAQVWADLYEKKYPLVANYIHSYYDFCQLNMRSLPGLMMAFSLFALFKDIKMKTNLLINKLSKFTLGIYCFHQGINCIEYLWKRLLNVPYYISNLIGIQRCLFFILIVVVVFVLGAVIEFLRQKIVLELFEKRRWYISFCDDINKFMVGALEDDREKKLIVLFCIFIIIIRIYVFLA